VRGFVKQHGILYYLKTGSYICSANEVEEIKNTSTAGVTNMRLAGRMWPRKEFRAVREAFRRDQQLLLSFVVCFC